VSTISNRLLATKVLKSLLSQQGSLSSLLVTLARENPSANLPLIREYTYGVCRWYQRLDFIAQSMMDKPLRKKDNDIYCLILLGLYQLKFMRTPAHAAINETVSLTRLLKKNWASKLVNAVLRRAQREEGSLEVAIQADNSARYSHPRWLIDALQKDWPDSFELILDQNNQQAPMTLRVNTGATSRQNYLELLQQAGIAANTGKHSKTSLILESPVDVSELPGFFDGMVSVQDEASQMSAFLLAPAAGARVLDACAAPGGKTCALLEYQSGNLELIALDNSEQRLQRVNDNLDRLNLEASVICADAIDTNSWWDGKPFDAILLDAPCSGTGVIRRHPDIKLLRQETDIERLIQIQHQLLDTLWPCLKPEGKLLYSTCSVLRRENELNIEAFIARTGNARAVSLDKQQPNNCHFGIQFLPGTDKLDGFYYALLEKY
jgi:16S rRNA (cytosine967-C5)-methyltransferase